ncbi:NAD-P-binding protein [Mycena belliarum]|uniref:NAD-P-binding protein n=1 Tax=Mycena belliarum TaxID=1033014 RepID=A0AAD6XJL7_9AGAR|nr:NAD-P-binding protein [Mycena belliae]
MSTWFGRSISEDDLVDLHGKVVILTGGNTGIGYATIQMLARKGAKVYMAARSEERAADAIKQLKSEDIKDGSVHWLKLDLTDPRAAKQSAREFLEKEERLDILSSSADHLVDIMTINHISHAAFTDVLLPLMKRTASESGSDVRLVNVASRGHEFAKPSTFSKELLTSKQSGTSFGTIMDLYGLSKLAMILYTKALQIRFNAAAIPITCLTMHPGEISTRGANNTIRTIPYLGWLAGALVPLLFGSPRTGAMTVAFAAAGKEVAAQREKYQGAYLWPVAEIGIPSSFAVDARLREELYESTVLVLKELE